jgi:hypothetical protein
MFPKLVVVYHVQGVESLYNIRKNVSSRGNPGALLALYFAKQSLGLLREKIVQTP